MPLIVLPGHIQTRAPVPTVMRAVQGAAVLGQTPAPRALKKRFMMLDPASILARRLAPSTRVEYAQLARFNAAHAPAMGPGNAPPVPLGSSLIMAAV